jgi:predicted transcriptional regulator
MNLEDDVRQVLNTIQGLAVISKHSPIASYEITNQTGFEGRRLYNTLQVLKSQGLIEEQSNLGALLVPAGTAYILITDTGLSR